MATVTVRNLAKETYRALRVRAATHGRILRLKSGRPSNVLFDPRGALSSVAY